jgi:hypothetical protein
MKYEYMPAKHAVFVSACEVSKTSMKIQSKRMRIHMAFYDYDASIWYHFFMKQINNGCAGSSHVCIHKMVSFSVFLMQFFLHR